MDIVIMNIRKKDFSKIQKIASEGMQFSMYTENKIELYFYTKYFWYLELNRAIQVLAAYMGNRLVGVMLADMKGEAKVASSLWRKAFIKLTELIMRIAYKDVSNSYDNANKEMLAQFKENYSPEGELNFLAVAPSINSKGIGTLLLQELSHREKGKLIYLFTNTGCTYQFYEQRGFERSNSRSINITVHGKKIPHECYLYSKIL